MARSKVGLIGCGAILGLILAVVMLAHGRELAVAAEELIPVELSTVGVDVFSGMPIVLLRAPAAGEMMPIAVGRAEADAILAALRSRPQERPRTHDLMVELIDRLHARVLRVVIDDLVDATYIGLVELAVADREQPVRIDSRPSDGLALAARTGAPILVARELVGNVPDFAFQPAPGAQVVQVLGITVVEVSEALREVLDLPEDRGVVVSRIQGLARARGLRVGDLIVRVNGAAPSDPMDFLSRIRAGKPGEPVRFGYWRDGRVFGLELPTALPAPTEGDRPL